MSYIFLEKKHATLIAVINIAYRYFSPKIDRCTQEELKFIARSLQYV